jgi:hypothetical protein
MVVNNIHKRGIMKDNFQLPDNMFTDNPEFVDTSHEFDDDCGDACKI